MLRIRYDGAVFHGWQVQPDRETVQGAIEAALERIFGRSIRVHGAGRTDAGVHALGQTAHFLMPEGRSMGVNRLRGALNGCLPETVRVLSAARRPPGFHARLSARGKIYAYRIRVATVPDPLERDRAWQLRPPFDDDAVGDALARLEGTHDFAGFAVNPGRPVPDTVRTIRSARLARSGRARTITFEGNGFLYKMVRSMVGTLAGVASGRFPPGRIDRVLGSGDRGDAGETAPPHGLYLVRVLYDPTPPEGEGTPGRVDGDDAIGQGPPRPSGT